MSSCRICDDLLRPFIDFGKMPLANGFLHRDEFQDEFFYHLQAAFCGICKTVQLLNQPPAEAMFHDAYPFFTSSSEHMKLHFEKLAAEISSRFLQDKQDPFVLEIGSNDGTLLKHFAAKNVRHLGMEPSAGVAERARETGVTTAPLFFNHESAEETVKNFGKADAVIGTNVFCHINTLRSAGEGLKHLLKPDGIAVFEDPYLLDMLEKTAYDQIYDEHVFIFSLTSLSYFFKLFGLELIDVQRIPTHGGSIRYWAAHQDAYPVQTSVYELLELEHSKGLGIFETYDVFSGRAKASALQLRELLKDLKKQGFRISGYAATSKSTTILNYAGIDSSLIEYVCDTTESKQGKFTPGTHIPVVAPEQFRSPYPDYAVLFAWNHAREIIGKERAFSERGGKWILHTPEVRIQS